MAAAGGLGVRRCRAAGGVVRAGAAVPGGPGGDIAAGAAPWGAGELVRTVPGRRGVQGRWRNWRQGGRRPQPTRNWRVLPELAGAEGYLAWAYDGFAAAHERLAGAVPGTAGLAQVMAEVVRQAGLRYPPGGAGGGDWRGRVPGDRRTGRLADDFRPQAWYDADAGVAGPGSGGRGDRGVPGVAGYGGPDHRDLAGPARRAGVPGAVLRAGRAVPARCPCVRPPAAGSQPPGQRASAERGRRDSPRWARAFRPCRRAG